MFSVFKQQFGLLGFLNQVFKKNIQQLELSDLFFLPKAPGFALNNAGISSCIYKGI